MNTPVGCSVVCLDSSANGRDDLGDDPDDDEAVREGSEDDGGFSGGDGLLSGCRSECFGDGRDFCEPSIDVGDGAASDDVDLGTSPAGEPEVVTGVDELVAAGAAGLLANAVSRRPAMVIRVPKRSNPAVATWRRLLMTRR